MTSHLADLVLTGAAVHTMAPGGQDGAAVPRPDTIAIRAGRIAAVGTAADLRTWIGPATEVRDLPGGMVLPAFQDAHIHPLTGGLERLRCDLSPYDSRPRYLDAISEYAKSHPEAAWISGGGWMMPAFPGGNPSAADLDGVVPDRPVYLPSRDHHSAWVNTRALELAGLTADTPDPTDGRIERGPDGRPIGVLHEGAMHLVERLMPAPDRNDEVRALLEAQHYLHSLGITAWQDAIVGDYPGSPDPTAAYAELLAHGQLTARVRGCLWWRRDLGPDQLDDLLHRRALAPRGLVLDAVKIMQDGICENFTAATLTPYLDTHGCRTANRGLSFLTPAELSMAVSALHEAGFQAHFHTVGERAVRDALDAVESAIRRHGPRDLRHHLAHVQMVHPEDLPRFAALDATANMQPVWAQHDDQMDVLTLPYLAPEQAEWQYPFRALERHGAHLAMGSDWPVSSPDPILGIHIAVNRAAPGAARRPPLLPGQRLSLAGALRAATLGAARVNHLDAVTGTLEVGKDADLVVLDRDLFDLPAAEIHTATVRTTMTRGIVVHDSFD
ncbi:amidohydrolase [Embleya sp. NPDC050493]|uniref:amidohydrolase n=1 Tax=Embleya sp. NPDC050493 TaxID=3363989 RepID=UPI0037B29B74